MIVARFRKTFPLEHMLLQLRRSPEQEQALQQFIDELHTKGSPKYHRWVTAQKFGETFGLAKQDLDTISRLARVIRTHCERSLFRRDVN